MSACTESRGECRLPVSPSGRPKGTVDVVRQGALKAQPEFAARPSKGQFVLNMNRYSALSLFRPEVAQAQASQYLGTIRIGRNPSFSVVAVVSLLLAAALIAFAIAGEVTRKTKVPGLLVPAQGALQISAQAAGIVSEISSPEGAHIHRGGPIFMVKMDRVASSGETTELVAKALEQRAASLESERRVREAQALQRRQSLAGRARDLRVEIDASGREADLASRRVALAQRSLERFQQLSTSGFVAETQVQQRQEELIDLQARVDSALRTRNALSRELANARAEVLGIDSELTGQLAQIDRALSGVHQEMTENDGRKLQILVAPEEGTLTTVMVTKGASVQAGQVLAVFVPGSATQPSDLEAHLFAPSRAAGFVQSGQVAWLRLASYPYQKFGMTRGVVTGVSVAPINPQELPPGQSTALLQAAQSSEPLYRIKVRLDAQMLSAYGKQQLLKPGMALEADVTQDRRAVWEWVFEPLLATGSRMRVLGG